MKRQIILNYRWHNASEPSASIPPEHLDALEVAAEEHITAMRREGEYSGTLLTYVGEQDTRYEGEWSVEIRNP